MQGKCPRMTVTGIATRKCQWRGVAAEMQHVPDVGLMICRHNWILPVTEIVNLLSLFTHTIRV